jgi:hypothetical protein
MIPNHHHHIPNEAFLYFPSRNNKYKIETDLKLG